METNIEVLVQGLDANNPRDAAILALIQRNRELAAKVESAKQSAQSRHPNHKAFSLLSGRFAEFANLKKDVQKGLTNTPQFSFALRRKGYQLRLALLDAEERLANLCKQYASGFEEKLQALALELDSMISAGDKDEDSLVEFVQSKLESIEKGFPDLVGAIRATMDAEKNLRQSIEEKKEKPANYTPGQRGRKPKGFLTA